MRWMFKPKSLMKSVAACASAFTMCMAPVAQGAAAQDQRKLINQYLKETGLTTKKMTVGEFYRMVRHVYPQKLRGQMDQWVALNRHEMMPAVEASSYKGSDGKEQVRLTLTHAGQTTTLTFTGDEENPLKVNGVSFGRKELMNYNSFNKIAGKMAKLDPVVAKALKTGKQKPLSKNLRLTYKEFNQLTPRQRAEYFVRIRGAMDAAQRVYQVIYGAQAMNEINNKYEWVYQTFFGEEAYAASSLTGKPCIVAGYKSTYGENGSCGGSRSGAEDLTRQMKGMSAMCSGNAVSCNPMVYGFDGAGAPHCVSRSDVKYATRVCNQKSPLRRGDVKSEGEDKKRIIESYLKKNGQEINLVLNEEGKISQEQYDQISKYLGDLESFIQNAVGACDQAPLKDIQRQREDQVSACNEIKTRAFSLQSFVVAPEPLPPPGPVAGDCSTQKPGSTTSADGKGCVCPEGTKESEPEEGSSQPTCVVIETGGEGDLPGGKTEVSQGAEDSCGFWCRNKNWIIPVGVGLLALGAFWWLFSKNKSKSKENTNEYVPPVAPPAPTATTTTTVTPAPVDPPPTAPCPAPNQLVNNVCVPVVVTPPPTPESEGGSLNDGSIRAGGVR